MYAIIEACGRQYKVEKGETVFFEKLEEEVGKKVTFDKVVFLSDDGKVEVGTPYVKGCKVEGKVISQSKGKKIRVYKYKAKKNERKTIGHRQFYTKVEITGIKKATEKVETAKKVDTEKKDEKKPVAKKVETKSEPAKKTSTTKAQASKKTADTNVAKTKTSTAKKTAAKTTKTKE